AAPFITPDELTTTFYPLSLHDALPICKVGGEVNRTQLLKGIMEACILKIIHDDIVYGYELSEKLQNLGLSDISEGTIYPILMRRSEEHTSELQSRFDLVCRLLLEQTQP